MLRFSFCFVVLLAIATLCSSPADLFAQSWGGKTAEEWVSEELSNPSYKKFNTAALQETIEAQKQFNRQWYAAHALGMIGPEAAPVAIKPMLAELQIPVGYEYVRGAIFRAFGDFGPAAKEAVPELLKIYQSSGLASIRRNGPLTFAKIGVASPEVITALKGAAGPTNPANGKTNDIKTRTNALFALWELTKEGDYLDILRKQIEVANFAGENAFLAVQAFSKITHTDETRKRMPLVFAKTVLKAVDDDVRRSAGRALANMDKDAIDTLIKLTQVTNRSTPHPEKAKLTGVMALEWIGEDAIPTLIKLTQSRSGGVKLAAIRSLGRIGKETPEVVHALDAVIESADTDKKMQEVAVKAKFLLADQDVPILVPPTPPIEPTTPLETTGDPGTTGETTGETTGDPETTSDAEPSATEEMTGTGT